MSKRAFRSFLTGSIIFLSLAACNFTRHPICSDAYRADIPGLEGPKTLTTQSSSFTIQSGTGTIQHTGFGTYSLQGSPFTACTFGSRLVLESAEEHGYNLYGIEYVGGKFRLNVMGFDVNELRSHGIPYTIKVVNPFSNLSPLFNNFNVNEEEQVLVVDNAGLNGAVTFSLLHQTSLTATIF